MPVSLETFQNEKKTREICQLSDIEWSQRVTFVLSARLLSRTAWPTIINVTGGEKEQDRTLQSHDNCRGGMFKQRRHFMNSFATITAEYTKKPMGNIEE